MTGPQCLCLRQMLLVCPYVYLLYGLDCILLLPCVRWLRLFVAGTSGSDSGNHELRVKERGAATAGASIRRQVGWHVGKLMAASKRFADSRIQLLAWRLIRTAGYVYIVVV